MKRQTAEIKEHAAFTDKNLEEAYGEGSLDVAPRELIVKSITAPDEAVDEWCEALGISVDDFINESLRQKTPILSPAAIAKMDEREELACIRRYVTTKITTPGVEVYIQDGLYHIASAFGVHEWFAETDTPINCTNAACRAVKALYEKLGLIYETAPKAFLGWSIAKLPANLRCLFEAEGWLVDKAGIIRAVIDPETNDRAIEIARSSFFCEEGQGDPERLRRLLQGGPSLAHARY